MPRTAPVKTLLILSFSQITSDPRVNRQVVSLSGEYRLIVAGYPPDPGLGARFVELPRIRKSQLQKARAAVQLLLGRYEAFYWGEPHVRAGQSRLEQLSFDGVLANDMDALPLALKVAGDAPVVLDAHEYAPLEFSEQFLWRLLLQGHYDYLCRHYMPRTRRCMTVCQGIADRYQSEFGISPSVVRNAARFHDIRPRPTGSKIRLIHHGAAKPSRCLETMIEAMAHVDSRFSLDLMLVESDSRYYRHLRKLVESRASVRLVDPVDYADIVPTIAQYDVGIYLLPPRNFNSAMALPNKFFEFVQARLATVIGPSAEMSLLVTQHDMGRVADDFSAEAFARAINGLTSDLVDKLKRNADRAARELSFEGQETVLRNCVREALKSDAPALAPDRDQHFP